MSGAMENRAAVFTSSPQDVEVYRDGTWWAGALLGWRHDAAGGCQVWVRATVRGAEETTWLSLDLLRLPEAAAVPERHLSVVGAASPAADAHDEALTGTMAAIRAVPAPRGRTRPAVPGSAGLTATMGMVAVRDLPDHAASPARRPGGRRRAPETSTGEQPAVAAGAADVAPLGRHRAPGSGSGSAAASAGRHRAADTGVLPVVRDEEPIRLTELPRRRTSTTVLDEPDSHLLTRPMRLTDRLDGGIPQPRRAARDGRLSGV